MIRNSSADPIRSFSATPEGAPSTRDPSLLQPQLRAFLERLPDHPASALALDYDGTLAPFHIDRHAAFPWPGVREAVEKILATRRTRLVLISGRQAEEVRALLGVQPAPEIWGVHGRQRLFPDGHQKMAPLRQAEEKALEEASAWLEARGYLRFAECKPGSIAVHWRGLPPDQVATLGPAVHAAFGPIAERSGLSLLQFDGGLELRPLEPNKGSAVRTLLTELSPGAPLAYLGDDTTDEDAFLALRGTAALTVLVRSEWRPTNAQCWLRPPEQLLTFLNEWAARCGGAL